MKNNCEINIPENMPDFEVQSAIGTVNALLDANIGRRVKIDFTMMNGGLCSITGTVYAVGNSYVLLKNEEGFITGDIYSIKFVHIYC